VAVSELDSRVFFTGLVLLVMCERLVELWVSRRNARRAFARGGVEFGVGHYRWMVVIHTAFLFSALGEVWLLRPPFIPWLALIMTALVVGTMGLRYWVVATLGDRWNTRVIYVPGEAPVQAGPYRWMRHPNYLAVIVELLALPLVHTAWITAIAYAVLNAGILKIRIRVEERALASCSDYERVFAERGRLLPRQR
jgi:methyltransferase